MQKAASSLRFIAGEVAGASTGSTKKPPEASSGTRKLAGSTKKSPEASKLSASGNARPAHSSKLGKSCSSQPPPKASAAIHNAFRPPVLQSAQSRGREAEEMHALSRDGAVPRMYIHPNLVIELQIGPPFGFMWGEEHDAAKQVAAPRTAAILGPPEALRLIERLQLGSSDVHEPRTLLIGPPCKLAMSRAERAHAKVPADAESYCFAYPARDGNSHAATNLISELVGSVHRSLEPYLMFLLMGGFCYFDSADRIVQVNCMCMYMYTWSTR